MKNSLSEAVSAGDFPKASDLIASYLRSKLGNKVFLYPVPDVVTSGGKRIVGIRFFLGGNKSIRLNWNQTSISSSAFLSSFDYWDGSGSSPKPTVRVDLDTGASLVKVLPLIVDFVTGNITRPGTGIYVTESTSLGDPYNFYSINEAILSAGDIRGTVENVITALRAGISTRDMWKQGGAKKFGRGLSTITNYIEANLSAVQAKDGRSYKVNTQIASKLTVDDIINGMTTPGNDTGSIKFTVKPGAPEVPEVNGASADDLERLTYEEQLASLKTGLRLLVTGATNALFLSGRGGCLSGDTELDIQVS